ncbi:FecR family protein [Maribacter sp. 2210JD10-5]|uniref:FecR family protein n=1 Tax=Maribacter sp. 2210JD10-5 TaxID=3386272 RepID=UPI0039BC43A4
MQGNDIEILIEKYLENTLSAEESNRLEEMLKDEINAAIFKERIKNDYALKNQNREFNSEEAFQKIQAKIKATSQIKTFALQPLFKYAAAAVLLFGLGLFFKSVLQTDATSASSNKTTDKQIQLEWDDGSQQVLTHQDVDSIRGKNNTVLGFLNKGKLSYTRRETSSKIHNTIKVPFGKRFQLELSDGTLVHLNAGSQLRYPVSFPSEGNRKVVLEGEAFFKVAKDSAHKFIVNTNDLNIEVLGTEFNVSAYSEDTSIKTTLREGSVRVFSEDGELYLLPNEQSSYDKNLGDFKKKSVKVSQFTKWMQGELVFRSMPFSEIIKKLERHFDVSIINKNKALDKEKFTARFVDENIDQVMSYFSKSYGFEYTIEGKTITIE